MSLVLAASLLLLVIVTGYGAWHGLNRLEPAPAMVAVPTLGLAGVGLWLVAIGLAGVPWGAPTLIVPLGLAGAIAATVRHPHPVLPRHWTTWALIALVGASCAVLLVRGGQSWDFRYIWGLKARVFAAARGFDASWLAWPPNTSFAHAHYPPLWPAALATGILLGLSAPATATLLTAVSLVGLAGACWFIARPAGRRAALGAGTVGAFAPVLLAPKHIGNADTPLAAVFALGLAALVTFEDAPLWRPPEDRAGELKVLLGAAVVVLPLVKVEGQALAVALVAGVASLGLLRRAGAYLLMAVLSTGAWTVFLATHGLPLSEPRGLALGSITGHAARLGRWLVDRRGGPALAVLVIWLLLLPALLLRRRGGTVALGVWGSAVIFAYLTTRQPLEWQLATSLARVVAVPLPAAVALAIRRTRAARESPESPPGSQAGGTRGDHTSAGTMDPIRDQLAPSRHTGSAHVPIQPIVELCKKMAHKRLPSLPALPRNGGVGAAQRGTRRLRALRRSPPGEPSVPLRSLAAHPPPVLSA